MLVRSTAMPVASGTSECRSSDRRSCNRCCRNACASSAATCGPPPKSWAKREVFRQRLAAPNKVCDRLERGSALNTKAGPALVWRAGMLSFRTCADGKM
jgi:hypothetical protein